MKTPPIVITLGGKAYSVRVRSEHLVRFYEIVRTAAHNKVLNSSPLLDDNSVEELWTIFSSTPRIRSLVSLISRVLAGISADHQMESLNYP